MYSSRRPCRQPGYRLEMLDGELLLYHPGRTKMLYCSETASLIWHLCDGRRTSREIVELLSRAYPEAAEAMPEDVQVTLGEFLRHGAIRFG